MVRRFLRGICIGFLSLVGIGLSLLLLGVLLTAFFYVAEKVVGRLAQAPAGVWEISTFNAINKLTMAGDSLIFTGHRKDRSVDCICVYAVSPNDGQILWSTEAIAAAHIERFRQEQPESSRIAAVFTLEFNAEAAQTIYAWVDSTLYALNSADGTVRWQTAAITRWVDAETVLVVDPQETLIRLEPQIGSTLWQQSLPVGSVYTGLYMQGARVYAQLHFSDYTKILAIDAISGSILWEQAARAFSWDLEARAEDTLFYTQQDERNTELYLTALDTQTGAVRWQTRLPEKPYDQPELNLAGEQLYLLSELVKDSQGQSVLRVVDTATGEIQWSFNEDQTLGEIIYQVQNERVYVGTSQKRLLAMDSRSGDMLWQTELPAAATYLVTAEAILLVALDESELYAFDGQSGQEKWQNAADLYLSGADVLFGDPEDTLVLRQNILYVAGRSALVRAIDVQTGSDLWTWSHNNWYAHIPRAHYDLGLVLQDRLFILGSDGRYSGAGYERILQIKVEP